MFTKITQGIKVSVVTEYQSVSSNPQHQHFVFAYKITIENKSDYTIHLLRRRWEISDAGYPKREGEGEGVVGLKPVIEHGQSHYYVSGCNLKSGIGKMKGEYVVERIIDGSLVTINIPEFLLIDPVRNN